MKTFIKISIVLTVLILNNCSSSDNNYDLSQISDNVPDIKNEQGYNDGTSENSSMNNSSQADENPEFQVSDQVYEDTFNEISELITNLNTIIENGNFSEWKKNLTNDFIKEKSNPETLQEYSDQPILKKYNIVLKDLEDYFKWVVMPSRSNVRLDKILFVDKDSVKAIMYIDNSAVILYSLEEINGTWKIR
ncbi:hypothetical protein [Spirochaeta cellobiosiphila]|uniref:hypothetical protein n=1 Tax=Spirochaeta cellobiosiphila TaxID=504483 RepID=UPI000414E6ED|nr:hypothetical protein [Spirochaeta cellobiosiphila]